MTASPTAEPAGPADVPLEVWLERIRQELRGPATPNSASALILTGVTAADLERYRVAVSGRAPSATSAVYAADRLIPDLHYVAEWFPQMGLGEAVGWATLVSHRRGCWRGDPEELVDFVAEWVVVEVGSGALVHAAAGFTPEEARAGLDAGTLTEADARALAALRGAPLPA